MLAVLMTRPDWSVTRGGVHQQAARWVLVGAAWLRRWHRGAMTCLVVVDMFRRAEVAGGLPPVPRG